ncbi:putative flavoprotein involved in K+ transport [Poseidonocella pacifica]|uniref:Putative flavoprotein involved in K+ transport n=1 Tax=Poseidonocella pacifica TaxID=871651 RepID=A0A1I0YCV1_9RHOB|nr:NAD(P)-binding domain-containing protein [Poseidonocella pacifica]SFB10310.1 putative flavoprotein involved in K+ transport [Poseidonocella pacifica]
MRRIHTVIIGAGQAGLAMSYCLQQRAVPHVLLERGKVANSWATERWDSLRLLTPNWQSRLPGCTYAGSDPDGFMDMAGIVGFLDGYAAAISAPVEPQTSVTSVSSLGDGYRVTTDKGIWACRNLVLASGACNRAHVPSCAAALPGHIDQLSPLDYRNPSQLRAGSVLVVGASATGVQLAAEVRAAGHEVTLAAGQHIRMPRHYCGRDIQWWMEQSGLLATTTGEIDDLARARAVPSLQLVGDPDAQFLDLNALQRSGVEVVGRLAGIRDGEALFSGGLANAAMLSDLKMNRTLATFDIWADEAEIDSLAPPERFPATEVPASPTLRLDLMRKQISTVIWATGFRPDFSWLHLPVFDRKGRLVHSDGLVAPGLYVLGLPFLRTRKSSLIDGVGADAAALADHLVQFTGRQVA